MFDLDRRTLLKATAGAALAPFLPIAPTHAAPAAGPKHFIFFNVCNGVNPKHLRPDTLDDAHKQAARNERLVNDDLASHTLPKWIEPLAPYQKQMTVLQGLYGYHIWPEHGAKFGFFAGTKKAEIPKYQTIDCALSLRMPKTPLDMLGFGMSQLDTMAASPVTSGMSARGDGNPFPLFAHPKMAYTSLFGAAADGASGAAFAAEIRRYDRLLDRAESVGSRLSGTERERFDLYHDGLKRSRQQRIDLIGIKDRLKKFAPELTEVYDKPEFDHQWWRSCIDLGLAALQAGVTNVVTFDGGLGGPDASPLTGFGFNREKVKNSHYLGHLDQIKEPEWETMRHFECELLLKMIRQLEATPEPNGTGSMFDHTLIVFSSDCGETQHDVGFEWPFLLIGNLGGRLRTSRYVQYPLWGHPKSNSHFHRPRPTDGRAVNAVWATLLHAVGQPVDHFNLVDTYAGLDRHGPLEELLV